MNKYFTKAGLLLALLISAGVQAADVGVSVQIGQPGFYGRLDLGDFQRPQLIYSQPRIIQRVRVEQEPLYLVVPPGHVKHWDKNCRKYNACDRQVYFVQERWYNDVVVPRYRDVQYRGHDYGRDERRGDQGRGGDHGHDRDNDRGNDHGNDRGNDRGNGHGNGHGRGNRDN
ncbi:MAG: hypothetical protein Q7R66_02250 [Undibacterium sp.]|uniref:hypothetical protein n=1 Tax=Undibacterium sp. TaxID=1914977 RepID=UPI00271BB9F7|nr:hypothetical protein [Undibacterium sp.]MDO8650993.1 hypothetical protein [Undibacterium sp.]